MENNAAIGYAVALWDHFHNKPADPFKIETEKRVREYSKKKSPSEIYQYKKAVGALKPIEIKNHNIALRLKRIYKQ